MFAEFERSLVVVCISAGLARTKAQSIISLALGVLVATLVAYSTSVPAKERAVLAGRVVKVIDGDTIDVQLQSGSIRVRFHGVDAPEKAQDHGGDATAALSLLIMGKDVQIEPFQQDRYERLIGIVYLGEQNVGAQLVRDGHACPLRDSAGVRARERRKDRCLHEAPSTPGFAPNCRPRRSNFLSG